MNLLTYSAAVGQTLSQLLLVLKMISEETLKHLIDDVYEKEIGRGYKRFCNRAILAYFQEIEKTKKLSNEMYMFLMLLLISLIFYLVKVLKRTIYS